MKKFILICCFIASVLSSCKDSYEAPVPVGPGITQLVPNIGLGGATVSIKGKRFGANVAQNEVRFSGVIAQIVSANDSLITVIAPNEGSTGNVTITANNRTSNGPIFVYGVKDEEYDYVASVYAGAYSPIQATANVYGSLTQARFILPNGVAFDKSTGDLIVADRTAQVIIRITKAGQVVKIAGTGVRSQVNGALNVATFNNPYKTAVDKLGNIYVADNYLNNIRKIDFSTNRVTTLAGKGTNAGALVDGQGTAAAFNIPTGVAVDGDNNVYIADAGNNAIRKITPSGFVTTLAGNGTAGTVDGVWPNVRLNRPTAIAYGPDGFLYVADRWSQRIRKIDRHTGETRTIAGSGGSSANTGDVVDGEALKARFNNPWGIAVDADGVIYVSELAGASIFSHTVRMIKDGQVSTIGGSPIFNAPGFENGLPGVSRFANPADVTVDDEGNIFVADMGNGVIRKIVKTPKP